MARLVVTGAASGIGAAVVALATAEGWDVAQIDRSFPSSAPTEGRYTADVADQREVGQVVAAVTSAWGAPPDALVHCAGVYRVAASTEVDTAAWDEVVGINARGSFFVARAVAAGMLAAGTEGAVVLLGSVASSRGDAGEPSAAYAASKGAVGSLTRQLAVEWGPAGIRVNAVVPGVIDTPMTTIVEDADATAALLTRLPMRRLGRADEVAAACMFLAGPRSSYITGTEIVVDGGYLAS
ncbi:short-chain dehydrogenase [Mycolicibacterium agri]|jgi:NAD(P)-dependent dehydrogenase (short-subunit alcohol dehydrogenase family)|uniref:Oxidoreductase n=1 Tax=Mycolicibacterium agri TaxID=36811 RepID=A0A2A7NAI0_MYCAG|nr:SDR family oxidoreductase [Mycolicibacterium agri]PEG40468.1 short-chain dehydrogenase [Mycolicibacterium agri]GFG51817.1 oxidoreductase [Mycolicibacterium agri]